MSRPAFFVVSGLLFAASAAVTITWCASMSAMGEMPMPGGWTMSMAWMRMPGQTWPGAAASFLGMWSVMMIAMMLPSLAPMLWRYYQGIETSDARPGWLTAVAAVSYFSLWTVIGLAAFSIGIAVAEIEMAHAGVARAVPATAGISVLTAGVFQFTPCKARWLLCCRSSGGHEYGTADVAGAWQYGLNLGLRCGGCCAGLTAILLILGVMDLRAMAVVTAAITAERLAPRGLVVARAIGVVALGTGLFLVARAAALA